MRARGPQPAAHTGVVDAADAHAHFAIGCDHQALHARSIHLRAHAYKSLLSLTHY